MTHLWIRLWAIVIRFNLANGKFQNNVFKLIAGNFIAQGASLAAYPILTRIYVPEQFGILSFIVAATNTLQPLIGLRYEMALPLTKSDEEAGNVIVVCGVALLLTVGLVTVGLWWLPLPLLSRFSTIAPYRMFIALGTLGIGSYIILIYEATRRSRYTDLARTRIVQSIGGPIVQIVLGTVGAGTLGLLIGFLVAGASGSAGLSKKMAFITLTKQIRITSYDERTSRLFNHRSYAGDDSGRRGNFG